METTYFRVPVYFGGTECDAAGGLKKLPFFEFCEASALGSTYMQKEDGRAAIYLHDFEAFSRLFIEPGSYRFQT
jgi:hypothetical protein